MAKAIMTTTRALPTLHPRRTTPWVAAMAGPRPTDRERLSEQCVRHGDTDVNEYRIHWLLVTEQNPFTLDVHHRTVTVAYPDGNRCNRQGCTAVQL